MDKYYSEEIQSSFSESLKPPTRDYNTMSTFKASLDRPIEEVTSSISAKNKRLGVAFTEDEDIKSKIFETQSTLKSPYAGKADVALAYQQTLLKCSNSEELIQLFVSEKKPFERTDAHYFSYDFSSCAQRLSCGFSLIYFDYNNLQSYSSTIQALDSYFVFKRNGAKSKLVKYSELRGVYLGMNSSTFQLYTNRYGSLSIIGLDNHHCITLFTDSVCFSFGSFSNQQIYDIYLFFSFKIFSSCPKNVLIPLSKSQLTIILIKQKLEQMAKEKFLSLKELLLLGIVNTLKNLNKPQEDIEVVARILNKSFCAQSKIFRICYHIKPLKFKPDETYSDNLQEMVRRFYLQAREANYFRSRIKKYKLKIDWEATKKDIRKISKLPTVKTVANALVNTPHLYALPGNQSAL